eukprot:gnl/MRDRNA2_/MRDRNA2_96881_c0_seq1.p1 gnl/MRDRNA2_/MRDRNA2_96881_c0~~gnl/MRDRNA2_/MRDRNA2_96881_c0_seq1.p1  ORF type:complete len:224 (+),score=37.99 gnl/MRDRNA2_/MRDRNA2_96881_c0_seq1:80-751(+)
MIGVLRFVLLFIPPTCAHLRPPWEFRYATARWLVHESDYGVVSTACAADHEGCAFKGQPFGDIMSISDGNGYDDSTGIIYTFIPDIDDSTMDLIKNPWASITFSEKAIPGGCKKNDTAEDPPCARLTVSGKMSLVPTELVSQAEEYLFARHPQMKQWANMPSHAFKPWWMAKENITSMLLIDFYGGATKLDVDRYLKAPWRFTNETKDALTPRAAGESWVVQI